jgi:hypothetical protein
MPYLLTVAVVMCLIAGQTALASPFGQGVFGADVPFGSGTSLSIALGSSPNISMTPSGPNFTGAASNLVTVTTTDVVGYRLYVYCPTSCNMVNGPDTIPASGNTSAGALSVNTWGYNLDASSNYLGMTTSPVVLKDANGPYKNGDATTVTYGVLAGPTKSAGQYNVSVVYTAVAKSE